MNKVNKCLCVQDIHDCVIILSYIYNMLLFDYVFIIYLGAVDVITTTTTTTLPNKEEHSYGNIITGPEQLQSDNVTTTTDTIYDPMIPETCPILIDDLGQYVSDNHCNLNSGFKDQYQVIIIILVIKCFVVCLLKLKSICISIQ